MPSMESAVVARLESVSGISSLVGNRIYPNRLPQGVDYPAIRYQRIDTPRLKALSGPTGRARPRFQIDCYGPKHGDVINLARAVRLALDGFLGLVPVGSGSPQDGVKIDDSSAVDEAGDFEDDVQLHRQRLDFILSHIED